MRRVNVEAGDTVYEGHVLAVVEESEEDIAAEVAEEQIDLDEVRGDLRRVLDRHEMVLDHVRPEAVARREK